MYVIHEIVTTHISTTLLLIPVAAIGSCGVLYHGYIITYVEVVRNTVYGFFA